MNKEVDGRSRIEKMKSIYTNLDQIIDKMSDVLPDNVRDILRDKILGDKELKSLMDGLDNNRPPRFFMIGRTGFGKSSLVNAMCGSYVAEVDDVRSCTNGTKIYQYKDKDRVLMEILDSRGIAESMPIKNENAEEALVNEIIKFSPDVAIFMLSCTHRDSIDKDAIFVKSIAEDYETRNNVRLPIVVVVNKCDEMSPARLKNANEYSKEKLEKINNVITDYKRILINNGLKIDSIIGVSSLIDWQTDDGIEIEVENIKNLSEKEIENLQIAFDGRYNIEELTDILYDSIRDVEAKMGLRMAFKLEILVKKIANKLTNIFAGISSIIATTPIPVSDIYILTTLQCVLVSLIAAISGVSINMESAIDFIHNMGGVAGVGYACKLAAQQASKLLNGLFPGSGSFVSAGIAALGTKSIGKAAIAYYIDEFDFDDAKELFKKTQKESN